MSDTSLLRTDDTAHFSDAEILAIESTVIETFQRAFAEQASAFTPLIPLVLRKQTNDWSTILRRKFSQSVGFVADFPDMEGGFRAQFAPDIPGSDIAAQEGNIREGRGLDELRAFLKEAATEVHRTGHNAQIRPLSDVSAARARAVLEALGVQFAAEETRHKNERLTLLGTRAG